jgi:penicillin amidase
MTPIDDAMLQAALPPISGELRAPGLAAPVEVHRDRWGIPHIRAGGSGDAWFALGFVHAQDRLFQMDLNRFRALGRSAEWLGETAAEADILVRRLGMTGACTRDYAALGQDARTMLDRYAAGVNAFLGSAAPLPIEYHLLDVTPEPWEPWHSIAVMRRLGLLMGSVWFKLWRMLALPVLGAEAAMTLRYDDAGADLLTIPPGVTATRWQADLAALAPAVQALLAAMGPEETGGGSNNWAVGPQRSATGRPILAGDPHRVFEIPGMYAQHHLACDDFDTIGLSVPGVPGFPHFGHNGHVAYCVTHAFVDIHDLFLEHFDTTGTQARSTAGWEPVTTRTERIDIRGASPRVIEVVTTRHGPIIAGDPRSGAALALRSVQFAETDLSFDCLPRMTQTGTVAELYEATRGWGLIDHNLVAGDVSGSIGHRVRALVPRRPRTNGWLPVPGWTGAHEWNGWIAHEAMPCVINPPNGVITTANNRVVADGPDYLCTDCHPPYRAQRMLDLLQAIGQVSPSDAAAIHADVRSPHGALLRTWLSDLPPLPDGDAERLRSELLAWDGEMCADASTPTAYVALRRAITSLVAARSGLANVEKHSWAAVPPGILPMNQLWWAVPALLRRNDTRLLNGWSWQQVLTEALKQAASEPRAWGEVHRPHFVHPLSTLYPQAAALLNPPSLPIGGDTDTVQANGSSAAAGLEATYGAIARYVYDVGNWDACRWAVFHGTSGHPGSPHYADQNAIWSRCEMLPMLYDWAVIVAESEATQRLTP